MISMKKKFALIFWGKKRKKVIFFSESINQFFLRHPISVCVSIEFTPCSVLVAVVS